MACHCRYLIKFLTRCCFCYKLRFGVMMFGCIFFMWFIYLTFGTAFMMESIFPNEYQSGKGPWSASALKTTMVFSFFGILSSGLLCIGVHNNNEMLFLPFLVFAPIWILVHILALALYAFKVVVILLLVLTILILIYAWLVVWSYYVELLFAYDDELETGTRYI